MTRATLVPQIQTQPGDVLLVWDTGLLADVITWDERIAGEGLTPPSHAALIAPRGMILEALYPHVALSRADKYHGVKTECWRLECDGLAKLRAYRQTETTYLGDGYDVAGLLGMWGVEAARVINRLTARVGVDFHVADWLADKRRVWCSEMVGRELALLWPSSAPDYRALDPAGLRVWLTGGTPPKVVRRRARAGAGSGIAII